MFHPAIDRAEKILAIGAHPDDIEIGCGGTLLRLLGERRRHVHWAVLSGTAERRGEAKASAEAFLRQAATSTFDNKDFADSYFPDCYREIKEYCLELRERISPDIIFTHRREDMHQDHRLVSELVWNVFRDHLILEYEIPKYEGDLGQPNLYVALEKTHCAEKVSAILKHFPSQESRDWFSADTFWAMLRIRGVEANRGTQFAEAFHCRKLVL